LLDEFLKKGAAPLKDSSRHRRGRSEKPVRADRQLAKAFRARIADNAGGA